MLDFRSERSVCGGQTTPRTRALMTSPRSFILNIVKLLQEIASCPTRADRLVNAALACAQAGADEEAVGILVDLESDTHWRTGCSRW